MGRIITIPFRGSIARRSTTVLVAPRVDSRCNTRQIRIAFEPQTARTVRALFIAAQDANATYAVASGQTNLFSGIGQSNELTGDAIPIVLLHEVLIDFRPIFFKVALANDDGAAHNIDAQITIQLSDPS